MRIAVLTGGGDCPGLNAVIRAVVRTASGAGWEVFGIADGFDGLLDGAPPAGVRRLDVESVRGILPRGGTILGTTNRGNPFAYRTRLPGGAVQERDRSDEVLRAVQRHGFDGLVVIGGDGTLRIAHELGLKGVPVVGVPKTIDNDLSATEVTFGFDTALTTATEAIDKLHTTAESHHRVMVLEVMGRDAGWIALHSGIAGGADVILIPEIPFRLEAVTGSVELRCQRGRQFSIVVVAEGAKLEGGEAIYQRGSSVEPARLGGIGNWLASTLADELVDHEVRATVLGHLQRGGSPTARDRILGTRFGVRAVELIAHGQFAHMVALRADDVVAVKLEDAVAQIKLVPLDHELVRTARALGIGFGDTSPD